MAVCNHPYCSKTSRKAHCGRHWYALSEDLRTRIKRAKSPTEKLALLAEAREFFEERMIGRNEIDTCRGRYPDYNGCGADIVWLPTERGKNMPVEVNGVEKDDRQYDSTKHTPHWATCPYAKDFKR